MKCLKTVMARAATVAATSGDPARLITSARKGYVAQCKLHKNSACFRASSSSDGGGWSNAGCTMNVSHSDKSSG